MPFFAFSPQLSLSHWSSFFSLSNSFHRFMFVFIVLEIGDENETITVGKASGIRNSRSEEDGDRRVIVRDNSVRSSEI
ncbi:hypothetical protein HanRHA438_Chr12g0538021 [Helianthus annuus]|nr:hypothetical protein HanRHA438_Chr12g0538021 [Helianthus annuus]